MISANSSGSSLSNFSCSPKSMQSRGIKLLNKFIPFYKVVNLGDFNIPILDTNMADGNVPDKTPFAGSDAKLNVIGSLLGSEPSTVIDNVVSSLVSTV